MNKKIKNLFQTCTDFVQLTLLNDHLYNTKYYYTFKIALACCESKPQPFSAALTVSIDQGFQLRFTISYQSKNHNPRKHSPMMAPFLRYSANHENNKIPHRHSFDRWWLGRSHPGYRSDPGSPSPPYRRPSSAAIWSLFTRASPPMSSCNRLPIHTIVFLSSIGSINLPDDVGLSGIPAIQQGCCNVGGSHTKPSPFSQPARLLARVTQVAEAASIYLKPHCDKNRKPTTPSPAVACASFPSHAKESWSVLKR